VKVYPGKREAYPEEMKSVAENQEVPTEEAAVETVRTVKKQYEDRHATNS
jgi:hypothetical protein